MSAGNGFSWTGGSGTSGMGSITVGCSGAGAGCSGAGADCSGGGVGCSVERLVDKSYRNLVMWPLSKLSR